MGVENNGGTGPHIENSGGPATRDRSPGPPPDDPGSSRQPSRLESRARAGQGQERNGSQQSETAGSGQAEGQRDGKPGSPQSGGAAGKVEASGKPENGQAVQRAEEPRSRDSHNQSGSQAAGGRDRLQSQASVRETDTRTEPADKLASSARQYTLPADNPGSSGQPSRLESHARARQAQEQRKAQDVSGAGAGRTEGERDNRTGPAQSKDGGQNAEASGKAETADTGLGVPEAGKDEREPEAKPQDAGVLVGQAPGERDRPVSQATEEPADSRVPEAGRSQEQEPEPLPRQDAAAPSDSKMPPGTEQDSQGSAKPGDGTGEHPPGPAGETSEQATDAGTASGGLEPLGRDTEPTGNADSQSQAPDGRTARPEAAETDAEPPENRAESRPGTEPPAAHDHKADPPRPADAQSRGGEEETRPGLESGQPTEPGGDSSTGHRQDETTEQATETQKPRTGAEALDGETGDRRTTDTTPPPSEEGGEAPRTQEHHGGQDGDRGRKAEDDGTEQNLNETNETNPEGRFNGKLTIIVDSDGGPLPSEREPTETEVSTQGRGEFGSPEDDPADRDPRKERSERTSRRREIYRGIVDNPANAKKSIDTFAEPAQKGIERVLPTGQHTENRGNIDQFRPPDHTAKAGDAALGVASAVLIAYEATRRSVNWARQKIGRDHGDNR